VLLRLQIVPRANPPAPARLRRSIAAAPVTLWSSQRPAGSATSPHDDGRAEKIVQNEK
jgi:hypothetical protein